MKKTLLLMAFLIVVVIGSKPALASDLHPWMVVTDIFVENRFIAEDLANNCGDYMPYTGLDCWNAETQYDEYGQPHWVYPYDGFSNGNPPGLGCYTGAIAPLIATVDCYHYPIKAKQEECCKEEEGTCCPDGVSKCADDKEGNPIRILSGEKVEVETDLNFNTPHEQGFKIYRTYKSQSAMSSFIGYGWTHNYNVVFDIFLDAISNAYEIIDESGRGHQYQDNDGDGIYVGILSTTGQLVAEVDGSFTWYRANGTTYTFNSTHQFVSKTDRHSNVQTLTYDASDRLETVTDETTGRSIGFVYNSQGRIEQITGPVTTAVPDGIWVSYQYDSVGNLRYVTYADDNNGSAASGLEYRYEDPIDPHNLTEKRNLVGEFLSSWAYDSSDRAYESITRDGKGVTINHSTYSIEVTDAQGVAKTYTLAFINGRRTITNVTGGSCSSCGGDAVRYGYDDERRVNEIGYANGRIDRYEDFGSDGRYYTEIQNAGTPGERTFAYTYHPDTGDQLTITESSILGTSDKETIFDYDNDGNTTPNENPTQLMHRQIERGYTNDATGNTVAYEHITTYSYDSKGNVLSIDGPLPGNQDTVSYTYDPVTGDRLTETSPLTGTITYTYDNAGNIETITDASNTVTTITYDGRNRQLTTTRNGITTESTYTAAGELDTTTDALDRTMTYAYNSAGFVERITDPSGNFVYYGYNSLGQRIEDTMHAPNNTMTHYRGTDYGDPANNSELSPGKPWKAIYKSPDGTTDLETVYAYDSAGNLSSVTDANSKTTTYIYDQQSRLYQVIQPGDITTTYGYDLHGNLASVTDANGNVTTYNTYDDLDRLVQTVSPDTGTTTYTYDETGNLRFKTQNAKTTEYRYDILGRLTDILYQDPAQNVTMTYDTGSGNNLLGRLASVTDPSGTVEYSYDTDGNLISETRTINTVTFITAYDYDAAGNLRTITYPSGQSIQYVPDPTDPALINAVTLNNTQTLASDIAYQPFGPVSTMTLGNTVVVSKDYDLNYQLIDLHQANGSTVMDRTYTPDNVGNITAITNHLDTTRSQGYTYDDLYRLTNATGIYGAIAYTYDKVGNRKTRTQTGANTVQDSYRYIPGTNRLKTVVGTHAELIQYDTDGNTTTRSPGASNPNPAVSDPADYIYNSSGQRTQKDRTADILYHYDQSGQLIAETTSTGTLIKAYIWLHGQPLAMIDASSNIYYYHNDHLGTPQKMTDANANIVWSADYLPFGKAEVAVGVVENNLRFAGQYYDSETGLHYNYHRYYDPKLGRYLRADPSHSIHPNGVRSTCQSTVPKSNLIPYLVPLLLKVPQELNDFSYVQNNPVNYIDFYGLARCDKKWVCTATCEVIPYADRRNPNPGGRQDSWYIRSTGYGHSKGRACLNAQILARNSTPPGTRTRHCHCKKQDCKRR